MNVLFPGERGSFAELAAIEYFGEKSNIGRVELFEDVFIAVKTGKATYGIVPIENTLGGSVHRNYDLLLESKCCITGEIYLKIGQYLLANSGTSIKSVKRVFSHPQALAQCRKYLARHISMKTIETVNTAGAVKKVREECCNDAAAIGSMQAAIDFDMKVLAENIQDDPNNITRFIIIAKQPLLIDTHASHFKSSIVFSVRNTPGALFKSLAVFSLRDIDLYKIESRPMQGAGFQYLFYLDFQGHAISDAQKNALKHLQEITTIYRFLGSYPLGKTVTPKYTKR